jgi:hypothetical protein
METASKQGGGGAAMVGCSKGALALQIRWLRQHPGH